MQFKDLKPNYPLFVLDTKSLSYEESKVITISAPRFESKIGTQPTMVVDVTLEQNGHNTTYVFPSDASKAYNGSFIFCTDKNDIIADTKALQHASETALSEIDHHKEVISKCKSLLAELDPEQKERQLTESRFSSIESSLSQTQSDLSQIKELLKQLSNK